MRMLAAVFCNKLNCIFIFYASNKCNSRWLTMVWLDYNILYISLSLSYLSLRFHCMTAMKIPRTRLYFRRDTHRPKMTATRIYTMSSVTTRGPCLSKIRQSPPVQAGRRALSRPIEALTSSLSRGPSTPAGYAKGGRTSTWNAERFTIKTPLVIPPSGECRRERWNGSSLSATSFLFMYLERVVLAR